MKFQNAGSVKYIVRKNHFYNSNAQYHLGNATQIIGIYDDFSTAKNIMLVDLKSVLSEMTGNCYQLQKSSNNYGLLEYMKFSEKSRRESYGYNYENETYYSRIETLEDVEIFNLKYPIQALDVIITSNDFLMNPVFNRDFFEFHKLEIPMSKFIDEYGESHQFLDKGLFIDHLDYFNNVTRSSVNSRIITLYNLLKFNSGTFIDLNVTQKFVDSLPSGYIEILSNKTVSIKKIDYKILADFNELLKVKPIEFQRIKLEDVGSFELESYKDIVTEAIVYLLGNCERTHEDILELGLQNILSLSNDFISNIVSKYNLTDPI